MDLVIAVLVFVAAAMLKEAASLWKMRQTSKTPESTPCQEGRIRQIESAVSRIEAAMNEHVREHDREVVPTLGEILSRLKSLATDVKLLPREGP